MATNYKVFDQFRKKTMLAFFFPSFKSVNIRRRMKFHHPCVHVASQPQLYKNKKGYITVKWDGIWGKEK